MSFMMRLWRGRTLGTDEVLQVRELSVHYGGVHAVKQVSLSVKSASGVCVLGMNGSGKSSLAKALVGSVPTDGGDWEFQGRSMRMTSSAKIARQGLVLIPEDRRIFASLTVNENLEVGFRGKHRAFLSRRDEVFELFPDLRSKMRSVGGALSGGQQQMLAIGRALMLGPSMLIMDEPSLGLAPMVVRVVYDAIGQIISSGRSVLLIEQNVSRSLQVCEYVYVMSRGRVIREGSSRDVSQEAKLLEEYL